jgi:probable HAF family extracellular repeat protein
MRPNRVLATLGLLLVSSGLAVLPVGVEAQRPPGDCAAPVASLPEAGDPFSIRTLLVDAADLGSNWCVEEALDDVPSTILFSNVNEFDTTHYATFAVQLTPGVRTADAEVAAFAADMAAGLAMSHLEPFQMGDGAAYRVRSARGVLFGFRVDRLVIMGAVGVSEGVPTDLVALAQRLATIQEQRVRTVLSIAPLPEPAVPSKMAPDPNAIARAASRSYRMTDLGTLAGYAELIPSAINRIGQIAGTALDPDTGLERAVLWDNGELRDLGTLGGAGLLSRAHGINDTGHVVGDSWTDGRDMEVHAFVWDGRVMRDLGRPGRDSSAYAINAAGQIVGGERDQTGDTRAILWDGADVRPLDESLDGFSRAIAINDAGQVLIANESGPHARSETRLWDQGRTTLVGDFDATALNATGTVVGYSGTPFLDVTGILVRDGALFGLGEDLGGAARPWAINGSGLVVGSRETSGGPDHAFLWDDGVMIDLNDYLAQDSSWLLVRATGINDAGQIIGLGFMDGERRAFLLTPCARLTVRSWSSTSQIRQPGPAQQAMASPTERRR